MENPQPFDRTLLIPIGVGLFSLIGICIVLFGGRVVALRAGVEEVPTATSFKYALIGTEPAILTVTLEASEVVVEPPTSIVTSDFPTLSLQDTPTSGATNTLPAILTLPPVATTVPPSRTPTSASTAPFGAGTFDNVDSRFVYTGDWTLQSNVSGAYQSTLHVSGTLGNTIFFRFIGQELRVFFQAGTSLGTVRLNLDGINYDHDEAFGPNEWVLPTVSNGTHTVTITHQSGGSVNLDYIIIPEVPSTPTNTATSTSQ